jgi:hypothetical protein
LPDGSTQWRYYYTGCPTLGEDVFLNQQKRVCLAVSQDGVAWTRRGALMLRNPDHDYENVAAAGPVVRQEADGAYRMWYLAIGTRWGYYSICYAESDDGITWRRGRSYGDNLQLGPWGTGWERQMVEYPSVVPDGHDGRRLRLFYCGNGYGTSGIGTAVASALRAVPAAGRPAMHITSAVAPVDCLLHLPAAMTANGIPLTVGRDPIRWYGPDSNGTYWHEWQDAAGTDGLQYRALVSHVESGLRLRFTLINGSRSAYSDVAVTAWAEPGRAAGAGSTAGTASPGSTAILTIVWDPADGLTESRADGEPPTIRLPELPAGVTHTLRATVTPCGAESVGPAGPRLAAQSGR